MTNTLQTLWEKRKILNETYDQYIVDIIEWKQPAANWDEVQSMQHELYNLEQDIFTISWNQTIPRFEKEITTLSSLLHKCEKSLEKLTKGTAQHTLLTNRIHALRVAIDLMKK